MTSTSRPPDNRCTHPTTKGRCRMPCADGHASLCLKHWRSEYDLDERTHLSPEAVALTSKILGARESFKTATDVNDALSKIFTFRARKMLSIRDATLLAYVCQLILITLPGVHEDFMRLYDLGAWDDLLKQAFRAADDNNIPELDPQFVPQPAKHKRIGARAL
jgi:hypothetical protein